MLKHHRLRDDFLMKIRPISIWTTSNDPLSEGFVETMSETFRDLLLAVSEVI